MAIKEEETSLEKKSISFVEQIVEKIWQKVRTPDEYKHVFRQSLTDICI